MTSHFHLIKPAKILVNFLLFVSIFYGSPGQTNDPIKQTGVTKNSFSPVAEKLDTFFRRLIDTTNIPGITIAITRNDSIIYIRGFGARNINTKEPIHPEYLFHVASVSKPFVATAVMQLVERGKMKLDEKLVTYLPYFKMADELYKDVTIKQMLTHTSGFPDVQDYEWEKPQKDEGAAERYVRSLTNEKLISNPGEEFHYSNMAFDVLADVIAKVSGKSFETYVKENILLPLEMKESSFFQPETRESLRTTPHTGNPPQVSSVYPYNRQHAPSSTLNSNVIEMANWAIANLHQGEFKGKKILNPNTHKLLISPSFVIDKSRNRGIGLSWFLLKYKEMDIIAHAGSDLGFRSILTLLPQSNTGIIILSNYDQTPMERINTRVMDILFEANSN